MQEVVDLGGVTFMNKPFDAESLNEALIAALRNRPASPTGVGAPHAA